MDQADIYLNYGDSILSVSDRVTLVQEERQIVIGHRESSGLRERVLGALEITSANTKLQSRKELRGLRR